MRRPYLRSALVAALLALGACGPMVQVTPIGEAAGPSRLESPDDIALFSTRLPECPYEELALLTAYEDDFVGGLDETLAELKLRAWEIGADAVVGLRTVNSGGEDPREGYSATAVRFEQDDCTR